MSIMTLQLSFYFVILYIFIVVSFFSFLPPFVLISYSFLLFFLAMDERLSSYALIARAAINVTVPFLIRLFSEKFARLQQVLRHSNLLLF